MLHIYRSFCNSTKVAMASRSEVIGIFSESMVSLMKVACPESIGSVLKVAGVIFDTCRVIILKVGFLET